MAGYNITWGPFMEERMSLVGKNPAGAISFATLDFIEEQLVRYQTKKGRDKQVASRILRSSVVRPFVFAMYCLTEDDRGLCIRPDNSPVVGTFKEVYDWWVTYGACQEDAYFMKVFFSHSDALWYKVTGKEKPFCPIAYRGKVKKKKTRAKGEIPNHLLKTYEVMQEILRSGTFRNFSVGEILPTVRALLHTKGEHLPQLQTKRKLYGVLPRMIERGELIKSPDFKRLFIIP
jgi:hypothetical protein